MHGGGGRQFLAQVDAQQVDQLRRRHGVDKSGT